MLINLVISRNDSLFELLLAIIQNKQKGEIEFENKELLLSKEVIKIIVVDISCSSFVELWC